MTNYMKVLVVGTYIVFWSLSIHTSDTQRKRAFVKLVCPPQWHPQSASESFKMSHYHPNERSHNIMNQPPEKYTALASNYIPEVNHGTTTDSPSFMLSPIITQIGKGFHTIVWSHPWRAFLCAKIKEDHLVQRCSSNAKLVTFLSIQYRHINRISGSGEIVPVWAFSAAITTSTHLSEIYATRLCVQCEGRKSSSF